MAKITFEEPSKLKGIREGVFARCPLTSITIPASVEDIDGSAFVHCPLLVIRVAAANKNFIVQGTMLTTADGTEVVRYFGREQEVIVPKTVEVLGKSCFQSCSHVEKVIFENGSKLRRIGSSALSDCAFVTRFVIPNSVVTIENAAFTKCDGLEQCLIDKDAVLVQIGEKAFAHCHALRSFYVPRSVAGIGKKCFKRCYYLRQLNFGSGGSLKRIVGEVTLNDALEIFGFSDTTALLKIKVNEHGGDLEFPGWISDGDGGSALVLVEANK
jgi:hypothetical protein